MAYMKREEAAYAAEVRAKLEKNLHRRAKELGYELTKIAVPKSEQADGTEPSSG
jgi:hypothetical protein